MSEQPEAVEINVQCPHCGQYQWRKVEGCSSCYLAARVLESLHQIERGEWKVELLGGWHDHSNTAYVCREIGLVLIVFVDGGGWDYLDSVITGRGIKIEIWPHLEIERDVTSEAYKHHQRLWGAVQDYRPEIEASWPGDWY